MDLIPVPTGFDDPGPGLLYRITFADQHMATIALRGELDLVSVRDLAWVFTSLEKVRVVDVVVDTAGVSFIDCSVLDTVVGAHRRCTSRGGRLRIDPPGQAVRRFLELTDTSTLLTGQPPADDEGEVHAN